MPFFLSVFPFFFRDFRGSVGINLLVFFCGFPCDLPKKQGTEGQGTWLFQTWLIFTRKRSFADLRLRSFALICVFLRTTAFGTTAFGNSRNHPNFPHVRSIEYSKHAHQPQTCCKTQDKQQKCSPKKGNAEHADDQREKSKIWKVALSGMTLGDMEQFIPQESDDSTQVKYYYAD